MKKNLIYNVKFKRHIFFCYIVWVSSVYIVPCCFDLFYYTLCNILYIENKLAFFWSRWFESTFILIRQIFFTECAVGYESILGKPCKRCSMNTYGTKCLKQCNCAVEKYVYKIQQVFKSIHVLLNLQKVFFILFHNIPFD